MKPELKTDEDPSPLAAFVDVVTSMARNRRMLIGAVATVSDWPTVLEDLELMVREKVIIGLRSRWVRRVAVPIFQAHRALHVSGEDDSIRARKALEILKQCTDPKMKDECGGWIMRRYGVVGWPH